MEADYGEEESNTARIHLLMIALLVQLDLMPGASVNRGQLGPTYIWHSTSLKGGATFFPTVHASLSTIMSTTERSTDNVARQVLTHAVCAFGCVADKVVVHQNGRIVDIKIVTAAADHDHRRHSQLQPQRAHPVNELCTGRRRSADQPIGAFTPLTTQQGRGGRKEGGREGRREGGGGGGAFVRGLRLYRRTSRPTRASALANVGGHEIWL